MTENICRDVTFEPPDFDNPQELDAVLYALTNGAYNLIVTGTMALIEFLAKSAGVSFEIMCYALIHTNKQTKEEH